MKKQILFLSFFCALLLSSACHRNDTRVETLKIEQMRNPESIQLISKALVPLQGVVKLSPDYENRELTVTFNGLVIYMKNIEYAIVKAGFSLPHWPAAEADKAKLPEELR